jgi:uncharacterized protein YqjF (DUF2071 family)
MTTPDWNEVRAAVDHRPFAPPSSPWLMTMSWCDLAFLHWRVDAAVLRALVPKALPLDLYDGEAFVGVVPFRMEHVSARFLPDLPGVSAFPELNVRTYVVVDGQPGVYFFSLDATQPLAIWGARTFFHLNYLKADMRCVAEGDDVDAPIVYACDRVDGRGGAAAFHARYGPRGPVRESAPGSLEAFLSERYCLYTVDDDGRPLRGHIQHRRWPLQDGFCDIADDTMVPLGLARSGPPLVHFARRIDVVGWPLEPADRGPP